MAQFTCNTCGQKFSLAGLSKHYNYSITCAQSTIVPWTTTQNSSDTDESNMSEDTRNIQEEAKNDNDSYSSTDVECIIPSWSRQNTSLYNHAMLTNVIEVLPNGMDILNQKYLLSLLPNNTLIVPKEKRFTTEEKTYISLLKLLKQTQLPQYMFTRIMEWPKILLHIYIMISCRDIHPVQH